MNANDTVYGHIKNGVLAISGNNPSIRVDGGYLVVSDGPIAVPATHEGPALPVEQRMVTHRFRRADCPIDRIVITRPDGFITFAAIKWLHGVGVSLVQLDWDGTVLLATAPAGNDQPTLRRAQALASGNEIGHAIIREILRAKLNGQAAVARLLGSEEVAGLIGQLANELDAATDAMRLLAIEATAASAYWPLWVELPLRFGRRYDTPEHWRSFGGRHSPLSGKPLKAASPGNAILNYLYAVAVGEMTIALIGAGLDQGIGVFHADKERRASLAYDAIEAIRPYVDSWLVYWLASAHFAKRDFYEEPDGAVRLTRPLTSHLAMTAAIWRPAAQAVAGWLVRALVGSIEQRVPPPLAALPAPRRTWPGLQPPMPKTCYECGKALAGRQQKFCSEACTVAFHLATTTAPTASDTPALPVRAAPSESPAAGNRFNPGSAEKNRRHFALRRAWDAVHTPGQGLSRAPVQKRKHQPAGVPKEQLQEWFATTVGPRLSSCRVSEICRATGLSKRYAIMMRKGCVPHPRHYLVLAELVGVEAPSRDGQ
jgi:CRISPR-associated endonuclease Cas1